VWYINRTDFRRSHIMRYTPRLQCNNMYIYILFMWNRYIAGILRSHIHTVRTLNLLHRTHHIIVNTPNRIEDLPRDYYQKPDVPPPRLLWLVRLPSNRILQPDGLSVPAKPWHKKLHLKNHSSGGVARLVFLYSVFFIPPLRPHNTYVYPRPGVWTGRRVCAEKYIL